MLANDASLDGIGSPGRLNKFLEVYRSSLLDDVIPFWSRHSIDIKYGGFLTCLDREGQLVDSDKAIWLQGRMTWLFATLYSEVEQKEEWLQFALSGAEFLLKHGFDRDGRMFFQVARDGAPIRKRRYFFSECFAIIAFAALSRATGDKAWAARAGELFLKIGQYMDHPELLPAKFTDTRPTRGLAQPMIMIATAQILRESTGHPAAGLWIDKAISMIETYFVKKEYGVVMETVGQDGQILDHFDGRLLNPGHAIEAAWFILKEAKHRHKDPRLIALGTQMLDWMWERGWDTEYGGLIYYRDLLGKPIQEYWHDMKFWWPQNETVVATLLAWQLTRAEKYLRWHEQVHDWSYQHFPDPTFGEWYGYLHRDGRVSTTLKGNMWKSAFHLSRMQLLSWQILEEELNGH